MLGSSHWTGCECTCTSEGKDLLHNFEQLLADLERGVTFHDCSPVALLGPQIQ